MKEKEETLKRVKLPSFWVIALERCKRYCGIYHGPH